MKRSRYRTHDHAFGQLMLALRNAIGLTQAGLAQRLAVSRRAVGGWESGERYPQPAHLKALIALAVQQHAFPAGREAREIRVLWRAAHQKVLIDEQWLAELLDRPERAAAPVAIELSEATGVLRAPGTGVEPQVDWSDALDVPMFYGRTEELALLTRWIGEEHCRVVCVLGLGGVGKSALAVTLMRQVAAQFDVVIWRSLRDAPTCGAVVETCLQVLDPHALRNMPDTLDERLNLLMEQLRRRRTLLVLDNGEMLLEAGTGTGRLRAGAEGYAQLFRRIGATAHRSCLLLTSRETPADLVPLQGSHAPVRTLRLAGLGTEAGERLLVENEVGGSPHERARLVELYQGNPLALKMVAQTIRELFAGEVVPFLAQDAAIFRGVRELLDGQFERLSVLEQSIVCWLAILREPVTLDELVAMVSQRRPGAHVLDALNGLRRRSLIERGQRSGSFTLQSVVLEFVTARLIVESRHEIEHGRLDRLLQHALCHAQAKEYVRQVQQRLLVVPLLDQLRSTYPAQGALDDRFRRLLHQLREVPMATHGYGPANLVTLLRVLRGDLRRLDLTGLVLRGVSLQGVDMQDTRLAGAACVDSSFTATFNAIAAVAVSTDGQYWAAASWRGEIWIWTRAGKTLHLVWQAHISSVSALAFRSDGRTLASAGWDGTVKLWDTASGALFWAGEHPGGANCLAFAPDGHVLASGGNDTLIRFWDPRSGTNAQTFAGEGGALYALAWSPDGRLLAAGCTDATIRVWQPRAAEPATQVLTLAGHTQLVTGLAFAPDGAHLASASPDSTIKLWAVSSGDCLQTFSEHTDRALCVSWSPDGRTLASAGSDRTIWLRDIVDPRSRTALHGHGAVIYALAFTSDSRTLLSGSEDGTVRVWDVEARHCLRVFGGYTASVYDVDWSPDGTQLASGGADTEVTVWDLTGAAPPRVLGTPGTVVFGVGWSRDGQWLASTELANAIRLWDTSSAAGAHLFAYHDDPANFFFSPAWGQDGRLAVGTYAHGVQIVEPWAQGRRRAANEVPIWIRRVAWSPDGTRLAAGGGDGSVYILDAADGRELLRLQGHQGPVVSVAWSPDGSRLASGGGGRVDTELFVWSARSGELEQALPGAPGVVFGVVWNPNGELLVSGGSDGMLRWWELRSGRCVREQPAHQGTVQALKLSPDGSRLASCGDDGAIAVWDLERGEQLHTLRRDRPYERMDITGVTGLTDAQRRSLLVLGAFEHPAG